MTAEKGIILPAENVQEGELVVVGEPIAIRRRNNPAAFFHKPEREEIVQAIQEAEEKAHIAIKVYLEKTSSLPVIERAWQVFCRLQRDESAQPGSLLFYLAVKNKLFAVVGDGEIQGKMSQDVWHRVGETIQHNFSQEKFGAGLVEGIRLVTEHLVDKAYSVETKRQKK